MMNHQTEIAIERIVSLSRDGKTIRQAGERLSQLGTGRPLKFMHVCGTHENTIARFGLRKLLPENIGVIAGPGCPVCVCPAEDIDLAVQGSMQPDTILATFGDMMRVPGSRSLLSAKAEGADVRVVTGIFDAVELAKAHPTKRILFFAIGFETTACTTAAALLADPPANFFVHLSHRLVVPALRQLAKNRSLDLDGFILPGHVLTITGAAPYIDLAKELNLPMVVAGFEPTDVLGAIEILAGKAKEGNADFDNAYRRAVRADGNAKAIDAMNQVFQIVDCPWRGLGTIPMSGFILRDEFKNRDAIQAFGLEQSAAAAAEPAGCLCGEIMIGLSRPDRCRHFGRSCSPDHPVGPCMVGMEGTCRNQYLYMDIDDGA